MTLIIVIFIASLFAFHKTKNSLHISILLLSYLFSCRSTLVPDTEAYMSIYEYGLDWHEPIEIGFLYLCHIFKNIIHFSFAGFIFVITLLLFETWYYIVKRLLVGYDIRVAFVIFLSYYGIFFYGVVLRSAIAITLCMVGIYYLNSHRTTKSLVIYIVLVLISALFQVGSLLFLFTPLCYRRYSQKTLYTIIYLSVVVLFVSSTSYISTIIEQFSQLVNIGRMGDYASNYVENSGFSIQVLLNIFIGGLLVYCRGNDKFLQDFKTSNLFINMCVFATLIISLLNNFDSGARLGMQWSFFEFIPITILATRYKKIYIIMMTYVVIKMFALLHYFPDIFNYSF